VAGGEATGFGLAVSAGVGVGVGDGDGVGGWDAVRAGSGDADALSNSGLAKVDALSGRPVVVGGGVAPQAEVTITAASTATARLPRERLRRDMAVTA
jgi:hypothetical protein